MIQARRIRLVNPAKRAKRATRLFGRPAPAKRRKRRNPDTLLLGVLNPQKGRTPMKKQHKKKAPLRIKHRNPLFAAKRNSGHRTSRRRHNPSMGGLLRRPVDTLKTGAFALAGLVATRQLPQMALGTRNSGLIGYAANLAVALVGGAAVSKFVGREAGQAVGIGGSLYLANRIISENFSPIPKALALSGLGDSQAVGSLGAVVPAYFAHPVARDNNGRPIIPAAIVEAARAAAPAAAAGSSLGHRR